MSSNFDLFLFFSFFHLPAMSSLFFVHLALFLWHAALRGFKATGAAAASRPYIPRAAVIHRDRKGDMERKKEAQRERERITKAFRGQNMSLCLLSVCTVMATEQNWRLCADWMLIKCTMVTSGLLCCSFWEKRMRVVWGWNRRSFLS